ncbi:MAG: type I DNA topoisomerase [bacterium]
MNLVIVESPTKAKTIAKFLDKNYQVASSYGHVRDLPKNKMGIEIENNFAPHYIIPGKAKKVVKDLKAQLKSADKIILATDEDREGEAIAWHLTQALGLNEVKSPACQGLEPRRLAGRQKSPKHPPTGGATGQAKVKSKVERIVFHEITKEAIDNALKEPRDLNLNLVDSQQARRILDRLVGYELSPFLWRKVTKKLSAGRVQSVAVKLIVEREKEIQAFKKDEYWTIDAIFDPLDGKTQKASGESFSAHLDKINGQKIDKLEIKNETQSQEILKNLKNASYQVLNVRKKEVIRKSPPPFITSTLQQEANRRFGFSAKQTMRLAQQLYEGIELGEEGSVGLITYMRTDSLNLAEKFLDEVASYLKNNFESGYFRGKKYYKTKAKLAQEAHEAIRPTSVFREPEKIKNYLDKNQAKLYQLIWQKTVASQMTDAFFDQTALEIEAQKTPYIFLANGQIIKFKGFLKIYQTATSETILPQVKAGDDLLLLEIKNNQHFTQPPARYSEAGLIKKLESYGIGRPSTYAPIISTIQDRGYILKETGRLKPTEVAFLVTDLLTEHFSQIVDYQFTAKMEDDFDKIAQGETAWQPVIADFYEPFKKNLTQKEKTLSKEKILGEVTEEKCPKCGSPLVTRMSRFGKFLACSDFPRCKYTQDLARAGENGEKKSQNENNEETNVICEKCGQPMVVKTGRFGKFLACSGYPDCKNTKHLNNNFKITDEKGEEIKCPKCQEGIVVRRRSKRGRFFYGCSNYPKCDYVSWQKPQEEK